MYIYMCIYTYIYIYIHIHTYIHTHTYVHMIEGGGREPGPAVDGARAQREPARW